MTKKILFSFWLISQCIAFAHAQQFTEQQALDAVANHTRKQTFVRVLEHYKSPADSLKKKAACYLISNMAHHQSHDYYWADSTSHSVRFDELAFADFSSAISAFTVLQAQKGQLKAIPKITTDMDTVSAEYLMRNIDEAFSRWNPETTDFQTFCEYVLPYRVSIEPLQQWRGRYAERFSKFLDTRSDVPLQDKIKLLTGNINLWFTCTFKTEKRNEPLPLLGALQLLFRKKGTCEDVASVSVFALRSLGIPAAVDVVPYWATSSGGHVLNCAFDKGKPLHFDALAMTDSLHEFIREPAKVFRTTFSEQPDALASLIPEDEIPENCPLRSRYYKDVTEEYWKTRDVTCNLFQPSVAGKVVYACVFNGGSWRPTWWGRSNGETVAFSNMCQGAVYLPKCYENGKMITVGYPVASGYNTVKELKPDLCKTRSVQLKELPGYLLYRTGTTYNLYYYGDNGWKKIGEQTATENTHEMTFENVPANALLLLRPESSERRERPFTIDENGQRFWW